MTGALPTLQGMHSSHEAFIDVTRKIEIKSARESEGVVFKAQLKNRLNDALIGTLTFKFGKEMGDSCFITELEIKDAYRRHGHATVLLNHIFILLKRFGKNQVILLVEENNDAARALYDKLGFLYMQDFISTNSLITLRKDLSTIKIAGR